MYPETGCLTQLTALLQAAAVVHAEVDEAVGDGCHPTSRAEFATGMHLTATAYAVAGVLGGVQGIQQLVVFGVLQRQNIDADLVAHAAPVSKGAPKEHPAACRPADYTHWCLHALGAVELPVGEAMRALEQLRCIGDGAVFDVLP